MGRTTGGAGAGAESGGGGGGSGPSFGELQAWFGKAISVPIPLDSPANPLARTAPELEAAAEALVMGRGGMSGFERVGVYNKQYWFRLVSIMQADYACAVHVLGLRAYNAWAIRYLAAHPPASPYLARLDEAWPAFMAERYDGPDREAALQAIAFDRAFSKAFDAPDGTTPGGGAPPVVGLAPHATVLDLGWDFPAFRAACLEDETLERAIPLPPGACRVVVWRGRDHILRQQRLSSAAYKALAALREPAPLDEAFAGLEEALDAAEREDLETHLADWFAEWTRAGIIAAPG